MCFNKIEYTTKPNRPEKRKKKYSILFYFFIFFNVYIYYTKGSKGRKLVYSNPFMFQIDLGPQFSWIFFWVSLLWKG